MKNISVANVIEVLTMGVQAGFIVGPKELNAASSIASRSSGKFLSECQDLERNNLPTDEIREVLSTAESFINVLVNDPYIDFASDDYSGLALEVVNLTRVIGGLKSLVTSIW